MKTLSLNLYVKGTYIDTMDSYDATEDYNNALNCATQELYWLNNQEWFDDFYGEDNDMVGSTEWKLVIEEY